MSFSFKYPASIYNLQTNANVNISANITGTQPEGTVYSITPVLPIGLELITTNATIAGKTKFSSVSPDILYTVSAKENNDVIATTTITISVNFAPQFAYLYSPYILEKNVPTNDPSNNTNIYPSYYISNLNDTTYSSITTIYPTLTDLGLNLNTTTGVISGTPKLNNGITTYVIRANNNNIIYDASLNISVQSIPTINYPQTIYSLTQGIPVSILPIDQTQYNVSYSIIGCSYTAVSYNLPVGLNFNTSTGEISGTPTMLTTFQKYTISIYNIIGSTSTTLTLNIVKEFLAPPMLADNFSSNTFLTDPTIAMRRKAEILKYKKNSANLSGQQYYSRLAKGYEPYTPRSWGNQGPNSTSPNISGFPQVGNSIVCNNSSVICAPTTSSGVPGPVMKLCYNPAAPLVGYTQPNRFRTNIGFKWPMRAWQRGDNGFPVGKSGSD